MSNFHDAYRQGTTQNIAFNAAGGASVQSTAFGSQTYWIMVGFPGAFTATSGMRIAIGDNPTASATSGFLPPNFPFVFAVTPGQKIAVLSNDAVANGANVNFSVTELS